MDGNEFPGFRRMGDGWVPLWSFDPSTSPPLVMTFEVTNDGTTWQTSPELPPRPATEI